MTGPWSDGTGDGWPRRTVLATALLGTGGCLAEPESNDTDEIEESDGDSSDGTAESNEAATEYDDSWPAFGFDATNVGHSPDAVGPTTGEVAWVVDGGTPTMNCSPIVADGTVYTAATGGDGGLFAIDPVSGSVHWEFETDGYASSASGFDGERCYVGTWDHRFHAIDAHTGEEVWTIEPGHRFGDSSPAVVDGVVYVGSYGDAPMVVSGPEDEERFETPAILALEAETGEERWRYDAFDERDSISSSPAVAGGTVSVVTPTGELLALDAANGTERWRRDLDAHSDSSPAVTGGVVYCPAGRTVDESDVRGGLWALEAETGEPLWSTEIDDVSLRTSPAIADGVVYLAGSTREVCPGLAEDCEPSSSGTLYAIDADTGETQWTADLEPDTRSSPAVADGTVYVGNGTTVSAIDVDGETNFQVDLGTAEEADDVRYLDSSPAVADGRAYVGANDGQLYAIGK
ncbi:outer membrane protein assembly factor BamB family protein [Natronobacterium texcoconense]|uniref:Outer membrane protein assembly factor BamB, contains PQQ-like beta-propeller repeat n=1 Tax=Natronobacterium texcoconense TaxID=1095778 RepID=A0A1H1HT48_NATTX|nr:PQQ-binding-like beta-propeller repeat protein [Natronobacterium texcoconense]SDR28592.1 Outer membrane protein assembly factor BamB, contains PQQ-like beta-propeller repeat [Natronobacterium texcoconense]